jgi:hypothetical protein
MSLSVTRGTTGIDSRRRRTVARPWRCRRRRVGAGASACSSVFVEALGRVERVRVAGAFCGSAVFGLAERRAGRPLGAASPSAGFVAGRDSDPSAAGFFPPRPRPPRRAGAWVRSSSRPRPASVTARRSSSAPARSTRCSRRSWREPSLRGLVLGLRDCGGGERPPVGRAYGGRVRPRPAGRPGRPRAVREALAVGGCLAAVAEPFADPVPEPPRPPLPLPPRLRRRRAPCRWLPSRIRRPYSYRSRVCGLRALARSPSCCRRSSSLPSDPERLWLPWPRSGRCSRRMPGGSETALRPGLVRFTLGCGALAPRLLRRLVAQRKSPFSAGCPVAALRVGPRGRRGRRLASPSLAGILAAPWPRARRATLPSGYPTHRPRPARPRGLGSGEP